MTTKRIPKNSFEESLKRLEKIVDSLERGEVTIDEALDLYEEGMKLSKSCAEKLKIAEMRIKKLTKEMDGQFKLLDAE
jgi:exodeoxyribonuclease VII small subunit